jgi:hypothetical protein
MTQTAKTTAADLTFGVELEVIFAGSQQTLAAAINAAGVACEAQYYNHNVSRVWKVVSDASVMGGWEIVSPVLTAARMDEVVKVCDALQAAGATVNVTCGLHVHVGAQGFFNDGQIRNILKRAIRYEGAMDTLVPRSRRDSRWANGFSAKAVASINEKMKAVDNAPSLRAAFEAVCPARRYHKLNIDCFWRQGTVEFRQHSGSIDAEKVTSWIKFCMAFVLRGAFGPKLTAVRKIEDADKLRSRMLVGQFGKNAVTPDAAALRFYRKRAKALAA